MFRALCQGTLVPLILRAGLAVIFIYHGLGKVNQDTEWGAAWATKMYEAQKQPVPDYISSRATQLAVGWGELLGGIAMALGFLTRVAALGIAAIMAGAIYNVTGPNGFDLMNHGYEYNFAILVMCAAVFLLGGGTVAVDRVFRLKRRPVVQTR
jgi:putative oxidoreductase